MLVAGDPSFDTRRDNIIAFAAGRGGILHHSKFGCRRQRWVIFDISSVR
jgi:hypothetical protein